MLRPAALKISFLMLLYRRAGISIMLTVESDPLHEEISLLRRTEKVALPSRDLQSCLALLYFCLLPHLTTTRRPQEV